MVMEKELSKMSREELIEALKMSRQGIDTPKGKTPPITDKAELKHSRTPSISARSRTRITPRRPKLK